MIEANIKVEGTVTICYYAGNQTLRKVEKRKIKDKLEQLEFTSKEIQRELNEFGRYLLMVKTIGLGSRKKGQIDLYLELFSFGKKKPEFTITENFPLYKMLKEFIK